MAQRAAVGEAQRLDPVVCVADRVGDPDRVVAADEAQDQVGVGGAHAQVVAADPGAELQHVGARLVRPAIVRDHVLPEAEIEPVDVAPVAAGQRIRARAARQRVGAPAAGKRVVAPPAGEGVGRGGADDRPPGCRGERRPVEVAERERGQADALQPDQKAPCIEVVNTVIDEVDVGIRAFLPHDDFAREPGGEPYVELVAEIAGFEAGDRDEASRIVDERDEELENVDRARRAGEAARLAGGAAGTTTTATLASAPVARVAGVLAREQRIGEGVGIWHARVQQPLRLFLADEKACQVVRSQCRTVVEDEGLDRRGGEGELVAHQHLVLAAHEAQQEVLAAPNRHHRRRIDADTEAQRVVRSGEVAGLDDLVAPIASLEEVGCVPLSTGEAVVACVSGEHSIEGDLGAEVDRVVAGAAGAGPPQDVGERQGGAVGEGEFLDPPVAPDGGEHVADGDAVVAAGDADDEVLRPDRQDPDVGRRDAGGEADPIHHAVRHDFDVADRVLPVTPREDIGVAAAVALEQVAAAPAGEDVGAAAGLDPVIAVEPEHLDARAAAGIGRRRGHDDVVVAAGRRDRARDGGDREHASVGEGECADDGIRIAGGVHQHQPIVAAGDRQDQVAFGVALGGHILQRDRAPEPDDAEAIGGAARLDAVLAIAAREGVDVVPGAVDHPVVAEARAVVLVAAGADQEVVPVRADRVDEVEKRIARPARPVREVERIDRGAADDDRVVAVGEGQQQVVAARGKPLDPDLVRPVTDELEPVEALFVLDDVLPVATGEAVEVVAARPTQLVVTTAALDRVGAIAAAHHVIAAGRLRVDPGLDEFGDAPGHAIAERNLRDCARTERAGDHQLIAGDRRDDEIVARAVGEPGLDGVARDPGGQDGGAARSGRHLEAVDAVAGVEDGHSALGEDDAIMLAAGLEVAPGDEIAAEEDVLALVRSGVPDDLPDLGNRQRGAVLEDEELDRIGAIAADHGDALAAAGEGSEEIAAERLEDDEVRRDARAEHQAVAAVGVEDAVKGVAVAEPVGVVAGAADERVRSAGAPERVVTAVEAQEQLVARTAGQHTVDDLVERQHRRIGEAERLDAGAGEATHDGEDIRPVAEVDDQVVAIPAHLQGVAGHGGPELDEVDHARCVGPLQDPVEVVVGAEGIDIGEVAADQRVVPLAPVQRIRLAEAAGDGVVAAIAALDLQQLLDVGDQHEAAVRELEPLDAAVGAEELVADAQRVDAIGDGDHQVVAVPGEDDVRLRDVVAEPDYVVLGHDHAAPVGPGGAHAHVADRVLAVADIEQVRVAAVVADHEVVAAATVDRLCEVRADDRLAGIGADEIDVLGVEISVDQRAIAELEQLDRVLLLPVANILFFKDDPVAGAADRHDEVERGAREFDVAREQVQELDPVVALRVEDGVDAVAGREDVGIARAHAFEAVIPKAAVDPVGDGLEAVDRVVAVGPGDVDVVLKQLQVVPDRAVAELDGLDEVKVADEKDLLEVVGEDQLVVRAGDLKAQRVAAAVAEELEVGPAKVIGESQDVELGAEQRRAEVVVEHHIRSVVAPVDVGVDAPESGEEVVAPAAVESVVV